MSSISIFYPNESYFQMFFAVKKVVKISVKNDVSCFFLREPVKWWRRCRDLHILVFIFSIPRTEQTLQKLLLILEFMVWSLHQYYQSFLCTDTFQIWKFTKFSWQVMSFSKIVINPSWQHHSHKNLPNIQKNSNCSKNKIRIKKSRYAQKMTAWTK